MSDVGAKAGSKVGEICELMPLPLMKDGFEGPAGRGEEPRTYGGLLVAQALAAAAKTANGRPCHSIHLLFTEAGDARKPVFLAIDRLRDGRKFSARSVHVTQGERLLATATLSFHAGDAGPSGQHAMPDNAPSPETLEDQREIRRRNAAIHGKPVRRFVAEELIDARPAELPAGEDGKDGLRFLWFRSRLPLNDDPVLHQAIIAFASDMGLVHVQLTAHNKDKREHLDSASLDHAVWFHRPARADDWLLYVQRAEIAHGGRGLSRGEIYDRDGALIASVAQEILIRPTQSREIRGA